MSLCVPTFHPFAVYRTSLTMGAEEITIAVHAREALAAQFSRDFNTRGNILRSMCKVVFRAPGHPRTRPRSHVRAQGYA